MFQLGSQQYQLATTKTTILGVGVGRRLKSLKKIAFSHEVPIERTVDSQGQTDGFVIKAEKIDGSEMTLKRSEWMGLRALILNAGQVLNVGLVQVEFDLALTIGSTPSSLKTWTLRGCHFTKEAFEAEDNQDALMSELPFFITRVDHPDGPMVVYDE